MKSTFFTGNLAHLAPLLWLPFLFFYFLTPFALSAEPQIPLAPPIPLAQASKEFGVDMEKVKTLRTTLISDYFNPTFTAEKMADRFEADFQIFARAAERSGFHEASSDFRIWWAKNQTSIRNPLLLKHMKDKSMGEFIDACRIKFLDDTGAEKDRADPDTAKKRQKGEPTTGDRFFFKAVEKSEESSWGKWFLYGSYGAAAAVGAKVASTFWLGPPVQVMNAAMEPLSSPVSQRINLLMNFYVAPHTGLWQKFWQGDWFKKLVLRYKIKHNKEISEGFLASFNLPGISPIDAANHQTKIFDLGRQALFYRRGWMLQAAQEQRDVVFQIVYHEYRVLGEQLNGFHTAMNNASFLQHLVNRPALLKAGATESEIDEYSRHYREQQRLITTKNIKDPEIERQFAAATAKLEAVWKRWDGAGIKMATIKAFERGELDHLAAKDSTAFALAWMLHSEMFYQENTTAIKKLPEMQEAQESARKMMHFYDRLQEHRGDIQGWFDQLKVKFDVQARIDERGFPYGGPKRPKDVAPVKGPGCDDFYKSIVPKVNP